MKRLMILAAALLIWGCTGKSPRTVEDFNFGWKFALTGDTLPDAGYASCDFDDSGWRNLHLPHDWSIEGEFSPENPSTVDGGALPGGMGWYRKHFATPENSEGKKCFLEFDGVFMNSRVYVNGKEVGFRPYGYSSFSYEISGLLNRDGKCNTVAVCCDNAKQPNSRWYSGCGIYRDVRMVITSKSNIAYSGLYVTTPEVTAEKAAVHVEAETEDMAEGATLAFTILDAKGGKVAVSADGNMEIENPVLWDIDNPYLYTLVAEIEQDGTILDRYEQKFGIRTFSFDKDNGFTLNGKNLKLKGVCLHHDMGCIGTAVHERALERELTMMKQMGVNAVRTSHNPPAPQLLDLCDRMGIVVMDESFDMWKKHKRPYDYATYFDQWHEKDMKDFVKRDRNHPCIIMWSIGNEILEQWQYDGYTEKDLELLSQYGEPGENPSILLSRRLAALIRETDDTRYITAGCNDVSKTNLVYRSGAVDIIGMNYAIYNYDSIHVWFPDKVLLGSETVSAFYTRGVYGDEDHQKPAYDLEHAGWGCTAENGWTAIRDRDFVCGTFVWTGFDYIGEPTPYKWPSRSSYFGIVDLAGFPKDVYWMYKSEWTDETVLHLLPHWNWNEGDSVNVWAYYNNADKVELLLNGESLGCSSKDEKRLHAQWDKIPFRPGKLEAVSYKDGKEVSRDVRITSAAPAGLKLTADRNVITADGYDLSYVSVTAVDSCGIEVPYADEMLSFSVEGKGELLGIDNGNPTDTLCMKGTSKPLFKGKALAVVRSLKDNSGTATLTVNGYGKDFKIEIRTEL